MKILHLNDKVKNNGGVEVYISQLMSLLPEYGVASFWLGLTYNKGKFSVENFDGSILSSMSYVETVIYLKNYIDHNYIDLIHVHSLNNPRLLEVLFKVRPVIRSMHDPRLICPGQGKFLRFSTQVCNKPFGVQCVYYAYKEGCCNRHPKRLLKGLKNAHFEGTIGQRNYAGILVMSEYMRSEAIRAGIPKDKLFLNPYFTPIVEASPIKDFQTGSVRKILFVGRLSISKGVSFLIDSFCELIHNGVENVELHIVGDGVDSDQVIKSIEKLEMNIKDKIYLYGWQSHEAVLRLISGADIIAFPSVYPEAFGIVGIEAMMRKKPVVAFDVGGVSTWLRHNKTGFLVTTKDISDFASKIKILIEDQQLYQRFSNESRNIAISEFAPEVHLRKLLSLYNNVSNKE